MQTFWNTDSRIYVHITRVIHNVCIKPKKQFEFIIQQAKKNSVTAMQCGNIQKKKSIWFTWHIHSHISNTSIYYKGAYEYENLCYLHINQGVNIWHVFEYSTRQGLKFLYRGTPYEIWTRIQTQHRVQQVNNDKGLIVTYEINYMNQNKFMWKSTIIVAPWVKKRITIY